MKKWILFSVVGLVIAICAWGFMTVQANANDLAELKTNDNVVVLSVEGMT